MIKKLPFIAIFACIAIADIHAQQLNSNGSKITQPVNLRTSAITVPFRTAAVTSGETSRPLTELNTSTSDAYPWLSADGLRLYCLEGDTGYYMYSRATTSDVFSNRRPTGIFAVGISQGIWLSNDEKMVYYNVGGLTFNTRTDTSQPFNSSNAQAVSVFGNIVGYAPSLTPDTSQLFLYYHEVGLFVYKQTGHLIYTLTDTIIATGMTITDPCQVSKDGLTMYLSVGNFSVKEQIAYLTRPTLNDKFSGVPVLMDSIVNNNDVPIYWLPSVSADGTILVCVGDASNGWTNNDLYMTTGITPPTSSYTAVTPASANSVFSVYPNPASGTFNVQLNSAGAYTLSVYNGTGAVVKTTTLAGTLTQVDLGAALPGIYYVTVYGDNENATQKVVVQ